MEQTKSSSVRWSVFSLLCSGAVLIGLLLLNSFLVKTLVDTSSMFAEDLRISQTLQFILPLLLIFLEYWIYDFLRRIVAVNREP